MEEYKFVYEHYRVPRKYAGIVPTAVLRYDDAYRLSYLIRPELREEYGESYLHGYEPATHGGKTVCKVLRWDEENEAWVQVAMGTSRCSIRDPFNYRIGRAIAKGRALKQLEEGAIER